LGNARNIAFWVVLFLLILALFNLFNGGQSTASSRTIPYSDFISRVEAGDVSQVTLDGEQIIIRSGTDQFVTVKPEGVDVTPVLLENKVAIEAKPQQQSGLLAYVGTLLPFIIIIGIWIFFMNRMQGGGKGGAMGFGKSKAKLLTEKQGRVTFDDVAGIDEAKDDLEEMALISSRCSWASARRVFATCLSRPRKTRHASCLSTRLTPWAAPVGPVMAAAMTSVSKL